MEKREQPEKGRIVAVSVSFKKGVKKTNIRSRKFIENHGLENDAHAGDWHRQVSLLAKESIARIREKGLDVNPGRNIQGENHRGRAALKKEYGGTLPDVARH